MTKNVVLIVSMLHGWVAIRGESGTIEAMAHRELRSEVPKDVKTGRGHTRG